MDSETLALLEFEDVLDIIAREARTPQGREALFSLRPSSDPVRVREIQDEIREALRFTAEGGRIGFDLPEATQVLALLNTRSAILEPSHLLALLDYLRFASSARSALTGPGAPRLSARLDAIHLPPHLASRIENAISERGEIRESAHPELASVRRKQEQARAQVLDHLKAFLHGSRSRALIDEPFITERSGRYVIPVKSDQRKEVPGLIHGTSSSGATVFLEPLETVELNNQVVFFRDREVEIIRQILQSLTEEARECVDELQSLVDLSGFLEARFACSLYAERCACSFPAFSRELRLNLLGARHPLLLDSLGAGKVVAIDVELDPQNPVLVISGPNTGGKTAALKTVGLLSLMALSGLPIPASESIFPCLVGVHADIGDHQSITQHLSSFSAHVIRVRTLLESSQPPSLVLLDELGRGTDPAYGSALAIAIIEWFRTRGCAVLATTHHRAVKSFAALTSGVRNASVSLDPITQKPTFHLDYGVAGGSSGLEIAEQLGLPDRIVAHARSLLGDSDSLVEGYLKELRQKAEQLEVDREEVRKKEGELEAERRDLKEEMEEQRRQFERGAEKALGTLSREFRRESELFLERLEDDRKAIEIKKRLQLREAALRETFRSKMREVLDHREANERPAGGEPLLREGDTVFSPFFRVRGRVLEISGDNVVVDVDGKSLTVRKRELQRIEKGPVERALSPEVTIKVIRDTDPELNLVGKTLEEAGELLDKYIDRAVVSQLKEVRIIHGFGTGRLKAFIGQLLERHGQVESFVVEGGSTIVRLVD